MNKPINLKTLSPATATLEPMVSEYQGNPMLVLNPGDRYQFQFGLSKAKMILANIDFIKQFVEEHDV